MLMMSCAVVIRTLKDLDCVGTECCQAGVQMVGGQATASSGSPREHPGQVELLPAWRGEMGAGLLGQPQSLRPASSATGGAGFVRSPGAASAAIERTPSPSSILSAGAAQAAIGPGAAAGQPTPPDAPPTAIKATMSPGSMAAAQAAWPTLVAETHGGTVGCAAATAVSTAQQMAVPGSTPEPLHLVRASIKLQSAGPGNLSRGLRQDLQESLGGEQNVPHLEASVRPGCVHLIVDALRLEVGHLFSHPCKCCVPCSSMSCMQASLLTQTKHCQLVQERGRQT